MAESEQLLDIGEDDVPLEGVAETASGWIELFAGRVQSTTEGRLDFTLPSRRGVAASGAVKCFLEWSDAGEGLGRVRLVTGDSVDGPGPQQVALLIAGVAGSLVCILWPFFPSLAPAAGVGAVLAVGAWLLTLRRSGAGVAATLLSKIVETQRERAAWDDGETDGGADDRTGE
ncbi:MAG: hypothetical protein HYU52_05805 [Acidobacteria bacterium]|nr:hypothetical protein [Acidobacteriota bacterium]